MTLGELFHYGGIRREGGQWVRVRCPRDRGAPAQEAARPVVV